MAGNTINMYGGSYVDVHDNEVVNLSIDKAVVSMGDDTRPRLSGTPSNLEGELEKVLTDNGEFVAVMEKAVAQGLCTKEGWQYRWKEKIDAVYFASVASHRFDLSHKHDHDGGIAISWKPFEVLFGEKNFRSKFNDYQQGKIKLRHKEEIDKLFK